MTTPPAPADGAAADAAWVSVETPFDAATLAGLVADVEGMLRVNPYLEFAEWREIAPDRYRFRARNISNQRTIDTVVRVERSAEATTLHYESGLKTRTVFRVEPREAASGDAPGKSPPGARLVITDDYGGVPAAEREARVAETDRSLLAWGGDLHRYFRDWRRWSWLMPWRWYMRRVWRGMKPTARRIAYMLWMVTVFEIVSVLLIVAVFALELDKYIF